MKGITIGVYAGFVGETVRRDARGKHIRDAHFEALKARLRNITDAEVLEIYRRNYWVLVRGDELPRGIDLAVFDFCLNAGPSQAVRSLQRVLGVSSDGHLGPATMGAITRCDRAALIRVYMAERRRFYRALSTFPTFGKGWLRRADGVEAAAIEMAGHVTLENVGPHRWRGVWASARTSRPIRPPRSALPASSRCSSQRHSRRLRTVASACRSTRSSA